MAKSMNLNKPKKNHPGFLLLLCSLLGLNLSANLMAQNLENRNVLDYSHPWATQLNPALVAFQNSQISLGIKTFHYGFLPDNAIGLKESHLNASFPFWLPFEVGFGGDVRYYSAGIFNEITTSLIFSKQILNSLSLGFNVSLLSTGFSRESFKLLDINDPLLQKDLRSTHITFGLGAYYQYGHWAMGAAIEHFNQPDIGFQTQAILRRKYSGAIGYRFRQFMPSFTAHDDGRMLHYGFSLALISDRIGLIRFGYQTELPFKFEAQINLSRNNSLQYGIDLPENEISVVSLGSHEFIFNQILGREPEIGQPELSITEPRLRIIEEQTVRSMPANLSAAEIDEMGEVIQEFTDSKSNLPNSIVIKAGALSLDETDEIRLKRYTRISEAIQQALTENPNLRVIIRTDTWSQRDANSLKDFLRTKNFIGSDSPRIAKFNSSRKADLTDFKPGQIVTAPTRSKLSADKLTIYFKVPGRVRKVEEWHLVINDKKDREIKRISGKKNLPEMVEWNWTNDAGQLIREGHYTCQLTVLTLKDKKLTSHSHTVQVDRLQRTILLEFKDEPKLIISQVQSKN